MPRNSRSSCSFGALSAMMKDHVYAVGGGGLIFTSPWIVTEPARRCYAAILLTARWAPFELTVAGETRSYRAVALKQMTRRAVHAAGVCIMSFQLDPGHAHFARFRTIPAPGLMTLPRDLFARFDAQLDAAYRGRLGPTEAARLFDGVVEAALAALPPAKPCDRRVRHVIEMMGAGRDYSLEHLAAEVGLSYNRLSHLFAESMGLSLRVYQHWRKVRKAMALFGSRGRRPLTEIAHAAGFGDSSHMCKAFIHAHGAPPSYFLDPAHVKIVSNGGRTAPAPRRQGSAFDHAN